MTDQTVIVKDHFYDQKFNLYNAAIFIVRDPYKTMLAEFKRQKTASHVGVVDSETIKKGKRINYVTSYLKALYKFKNYFCETKSFILAIHFVHVYYSVLVVILFIKSV